MSIVIFTPGRVLQSVFIFLCPVDVARLDSALCVNGNRALFLQQLRQPFMSLCCDKMDPDILFYDWIIARSITLLSVCANSSLAKHRIQALRLSGSSLKSLVINENSRMSQKRVSSFLFDVVINCRELLTFSISVEAHESAVALLFSQCRKIQEVKIGCSFSSRMIEITSIAHFLKDIRKVELTSSAENPEILQILTDGCPKLHTLRCPNLSLSRSFWLPSAAQLMPRFDTSCTSMVELRLGHLTSEMLHLIGSKYPKLSFFRAKVFKLVESLPTVAQLMPQLHTLILLRDSRSTDKQEPSTAMLVELLESMPALRRLVLVPLAETRLEPSAPPSRTPTPPRASSNSFLLEELHALSFLRIDLPVVMSLCPSLHTVRCMRFMPHRDIEAVPLGIRRLYLHYCCSLTSAQVACFVGLEELTLVENGTLTDADILRIAHQCPGLRSLTVKGFEATSPKALCAFLDHCPLLVRLQYCCEHMGGGSLGDGDGSAQGQILQHLAKKALPKLQHFCFSSRSAEWME